MVLIYLFWYILKKKFQNPIYYFYMHLNQRTTIISSNYHLNHHKKFSQEKPKKKIIKYNIKIKL